MKIRCHTRELLDAVNLVVGVVAANPTRKILSSIHLKADGGGLIVQGTDLDTSLAARVDEVSVEVPGEFAVPAGRLHSIVREIKDSEIAMELDPAESLVVIKAGRSRFKVPTEASEEFPQLEFRAPEHSVTLGRATFLDLLKRVSVAAARDATRYQMNSVLLDCTDEGLRLVSTDGKRLAYGAMSATDAVAQNVESGQYILALKGVDLLIKVLTAEESESLELHLDRSEFMYQSDRFQLSCRLVDCRYPDYRRALPDDAEYVFDLPSDEFVAALRQVALMTNKESNSVLFEFNGDRLVMKTQAATLGESRVEVPVEVLSAPEENFFINFNPGFLIDMVKALGAPTVRGSFRNRRTAGSFTTEQLDGLYRHIVMPLVTQE